MATKKKIAQSKRGTKRASAQRFRLTDRQQKNPSELADKDTPTVEVSLGELTRWNALIARAQAEAVEAAPRSVPRIGDGAAAALRAYDTLRVVRDGICEAIGRFGGES